MAKIKKEKFHLSKGYISERTTSSGEIEMYLHYDAHDNFFYFEMKELKEFINPDLNHVNFRDCRSKDDAINTVMLLFKDNVKETKFLKIQLGMPKKIRGNIAKRFPNTGSIISDYFHQDSGITMDVKKIMKLELNGMVRYAECQFGWDYKKEYTSSRCEGIIEWTPQVEIFLTDMAKSMDLMCEKVLKFFMVESMDVLKTKLESNVKLLGND